MGPHEYRFINLFRALAAFWVLAAHCQIWGGYRFLPIPDPKLAVDLFMLVSGFLMAANADGRPMEAGDRMRFWLRRFFRIAPVYYLVIVVVVVGADFFLAGKAELQALNRSFWPVSGQYDPATVRYTVDNIAAHVTFLFGFLPRYAASMALPDWSIGLEMQFYLAFPALLLFMRKRGAWALAALGALAFLAGQWIAALVIFPEPSFLPFKLHLFVAGMLLARKSLLPALLLTALGGSLIPPFLLLCMWAMARWEADGGVLESRLVRFASDTSYSVYLTQGLWIGTFGYLFAGQFDSPATRTAALFLLTASGSYGLGYVIHRWIEQPGIALGKRLVHRPEAKVMRASI